MAASRLGSLLPARWPGRGAAAALAALAGCATAVALVAPASAASHPGDRYNVGATHSPQLLAELAGPSAAPTPPASNTAAQPAYRQGVDVAAYQHPSGAAINWPRVARSGISFAVIKATEGTYYRNPYAGGFCYGRTRAQTVSWVARFSAEVRARTGRAPYIYTPQGWWNPCTGGSAALRSNLLWVPNYTTAASPAMPSGWTTWRIWQYSSSGTVPGIQDPRFTDLDRLQRGVTSLGP